MPGHLISRVRSAPIREIVLEVEYKKNADDWGYAETQRGTSAIDKFYRLSGAAPSEASAATPNRAVQETLGSSSGSGRAARTPSQSSSSRPPPPLIPTTGDQERATSGPRERPRNSQAPWNVAPTVSPTPPPRPSTRTTVVSETGMAEMTAARRAVSEAKLKLDKARRASTGIWVKGLTYVLVIDCGGVICRHQKYPLDNWPNDASLEVPGAQMGKWLLNIGSWERTGMKSANYHHCRQDVGPDDKGHCASILGMTHFIDDKDVHHREMNNSVASEEFELGPGDIYERYHKQMRGQYFLLGRFCRYKGWGQSENPCVR